MVEEELIPHLFRTEYRKIVSVLCSYLGVNFIEVAEDIASDTFLAASELWGLKGLPVNPRAWLYVVAKNKTKDYFKHIATINRNRNYLEYFQNIESNNFPEIDLSYQSIASSEISMLFVVCHPCNSQESQIALALSLLCGFGVEEIANAFLSNKEVIYKRLQRAKLKLREEKIEIRPPYPSEINERLPSVLMVLYLLFNEGYYSSNPNFNLREDLCLEAMRLNYSLIENEQTNLPSARALLSLMCFQSSRFRARYDQSGQIILYEDQDTSLWNQDLIKKGNFYLYEASMGDELSKYHIEAGIAYWHTYKNDTKEKWENILQLYNRLLLVEYSPIAALNRTYALSKANGKSEAILEAEKIKLEGHLHYHLLLGDLYLDIDNDKALFHLQVAQKMARSDRDHDLISKKLMRCTQTVK